MAGIYVQWLLAVSAIYLLLNVAQCAFFNVGVKYHITLNVYSGRDDPEWHIDDKSPMYSRLSWLVNQRPPSDFADCLGYRGFTVRATNAFGQTAWKTVGRNTYRQLETLLLRTCPTHTQVMSTHTRNHVYSGIVGQVRGRNFVGPQARVAKITITHSNDDDGSIQIKQRIFGRVKRQTSVCSVSFQPQNWNYAPVQRQNNCYNYATNLQTNTFAQPGRASGQRYTRTQAAEVYAATVRDGLTALSSPDAGAQCLIALVIWPGEDYHFLRLDNNGYWSQKSGRTEARDVDDSGNRITDPRTADRGPYTVFAGWLGVGPGVTIR